MKAHCDDLPKNHSYPKDAHIDDKLILLKDNSWDIAEFSESDSLWYSSINDMNLYSVDDVKCWFDLPESEG